MKVGTDGVLLGAWADVAQAQRVLDVGTGCGLIALMLAQRFPNAQITGLELDAEAARQAQQNAERSPFAERVRVVQGDFAAFAAARPSSFKGDPTSDFFDAVVSNPPFFEEDLLPPDEGRANARHTASGLDFATLIAHSAELLADGGSLQVIIPKAAQNRFHALCNQQGFTLVRATDVRTVKRKDPKRVMLHFVKGDELAAAVVRDEIVLMENGERSAAYAALCREFYL